MLFQNSNSGGRDSVTLKLEKQMDKLHELENILRSSDQLSPVTLGKITSNLLNFFKRNLFL